MKLICLEQCELPFMLNLPTGTYSVIVDSALYALELQQEQVAAHLPDKRFVVGSPEVVRRGLGAAYDQCRVQPLRTVIQHVTSTEIGEADLPALTDDDVLNDVQAAIIGESPMAYAGQPDDLKAEATRRVAAMQPESLAAFRLRSAQRRAARTMPRPDLFLTAVNRLIRLYMQRFNDFFVEEVTLHQLASQSPLTGVFVQVLCDNEVVDNYGHVGKVPPIMRRPWQIHAQADVDRLKADLQAGVTPNSVALLEVRAKGLLERGATRSAIIEASAALDLRLTQKLRQGFAKHGKSASEIDAILKAEIRLNERANKLMQQATGKRVADLDHKLYMAVLDHRDKYRHGIAHADVEPAQQDAEQVIADFAGLRSLVDDIPV